MERTEAIEDENGKVQMIMYDLFPGVCVIKVCYHISGFIEEREKSNNLEINFCTGGRFECEFTERDIGIMKPGDMAVSMFDGENGKKAYSRFPMDYYEGLCIIADCDTATKWMQNSLGIFAVDLHLLRRKLLTNHWYWAGKAGLRCEHVFREIYESIDYESRLLLQLKMVELFMLLLKLPLSGPEEPYYPKGQIDLVKHVRDHIISDNENYISIEQLAREHGISPPQLQKLFREVYGMPVYRYLKEYRLEQAAVNLIHTERSIMEIAFDAGFSNASKFSEGFKKRYGMTPTAYRRENRLGKGMPDGGSKKTEVKK